MNRFTSCIAAFALAALTGAAGAEQDNKKDDLPLRLELDLADGSHIVGMPGIESVPVETAYAKMNLPLKQIQAIKVEADHETATVALANGDRLKGVLPLKPIELVTLFGKASIALNHVTAITVFRSGRRELPKMLQESLVLYYPFDADEGDKVTDASGRDHHGNLQGATWTAQGKVGGAYSFDGAKSYVVSRDPIGISNAKANTVCAWFKSGKAATHQCVWSMGNGHGAGENEHGICVQTTTLKVHYGGIGDTITTTIDPDPWNFVCRTYDGTTQSLYVNGALTGKEQRAMNLADHPVNIGRWKAGADYSYYFDGVIDEVLIFDRALSADEVKALYDAQK